MGIPNFSSFVTEFGLRKKYNLSDTFVVIDGNNIMQTLFRYCGKQNPSDYLFGGNYANYSKIFQQFCENFKMCEIQPIFVFDGGLNLQLKENRMERFQRNIKLSKELSDTPPYIPLSKMPEENILPLLFRDSFKTVADQMGFTSLITKLDADLEMAKLANHLKCPLISNDSDFLIMAINEGVITSDTLEWQNPIKISNLKLFIECKRYQFTDLVAKYGLSAGMLPIFGSLMGNDGIDDRVFDGFFNEISLRAENQRMITDCYKNSRKRGQIRMRRMDVLLHWLKELTSNDVIVYIENYLKRRRIDLNDFRVSIESYEISGNSYLKDILDHKLAKTPEKDIVIKAIVKESNLPEWFLFEYFYQAKISATFFTLIESKLLFKRPHIENFSFDSYFKSSHELYGFLLGLLRLNPNDRTPLLIITRNWSNVTEINVYPKTNISSTNSAVRELPILTELRKLSEEERKRLLFDILKFEEKWMTRMENSLKTLNFNREDIDFWNYFLLVIKYWNLTSNLKGSGIEIIRALVLSVIYYRHNSLVRNDFNGLDSVSKQFFKPVITHYYCEFQSIYSTINKLMALLGDVFPSFKLYKYLNGILFYNLFNEIIAKRIDFMPFRENRLNKVYLSIIGSICEE